VAPFKSRAVRWLLVALLAAGIVLLASPFWLREMGQSLVDSEQPSRADMVVVLAGDDTGARVLKGAELVKEGYAPAVVVSGPVCCYGKHESDLAIQFVVERGYPREWFIPLPMVAHSTREEAYILARELERLKVARFILVTSDYHTRRAARVYRTLMPPGSFRIVAADGGYLGGGWWRSREGRKQVAMEWIKTIAYWVGM
jgi:uncharacterized SAM-binding protein YcdF (DUF218 family)